MGRCPGERKNNMPSYTKHKEVAPRRDPWYSQAEDNLVREEYRNRRKKVSVIIPTRNEEAGIADIINYCRPYADELLVIDGHSTDRTRTIAAGLGAWVVLDSGKGKGAAIRQAIGEVNNDIIVFIDADYSHFPDDIPRLVVPILRGEADHVVGSRPRGGSDELHGDFNKFMRMIGSDIITLGINYRFGVRLSESQNGFRAIKTEVIRELGLKENITTIEQEMTIKTLRHGFRIMEVPTHEYKRRFGESNIKLRRVFFRYVFSWLKYMFLG